MEIINDYYFDENNNNNYDSNSNKHNSYYNENKENLHILNSFFTQLTIALKNTKNILNVLDSNLKNTIFCTIYINNELFKNNIFFSNFENNIINYVNYLLNLNFDLEVINDDKNKLNLNSSDRSEDEIQSVLNRKNIICY